MNQSNLNYSRLSKTLLLTFILTVLSLLSFSSSLIAKAFYDDNEYYCRIGLVDCSGKEEKIEPIQKSTTVKSSTFIEYWSSQNGKDFLFENEYKLGEKGMGKMSKKDFNDPSFTLTDFTIIEVPPHIKSIADLDNLEIVGNLPSFVEDPKTALWKDSNGEWHEGWEIIDGKLIIPIVSTPAKADPELFKGAKGRDAFRYEIDIDFKVEFTCPEDDPKCERTPVPTPVTIPKLPPTAVTACTAKGSGSSKNYYSMYSYDCNYGTSIQFH